MSTCFAGKLRSFTNIATELSMHTAESSTSHQELWESREKFFCERHIEVLPAYFDLQQSFVYWNFTKSDAFYSIRILVLDYVHALLQIQLIQKCVKNHQRMHFNHYHHHHLLLFLQKCNFYHSFIQFIATSRVCMDACEKKRKKRVIKKS